LNKGLKSHLEEGESFEFPDSYPVVNEIKSPLNVLWYNLNFEFKDKYPAKMPADFARDMIKIYSKVGDLVWDGMCGSGTVPRMANQLGRHAKGSDINPKAIELAKEHDPENASQYLVADVRKLRFELKPDLILSSLPFGLNIIGDKNRYSPNSKDISNCATMKQFFEAAHVVIQSYFINLKPGGIMILDSRDRTKDKTYYDIGVEFRNIAKEVGFEVVCRYWYMMIPYRQFTFKHKSGYVMPMVSAMDAYVFYKPKDEAIV